MYSVEIDTFRSNDMETYLFTLTYFHHFSLDLNKSLFFFVDAGFITCPGTRGKLFLELGDYASFFTLKRLPWNSHWPWSPVPNVINAVKWVALQNGQK